MGTYLSNHYNNNNINNSINISEYDSLNAAYTTNISNISVDVSSDMEFRKNPRTKVR